jgi:hypothetical protein
MKALSRLTIRKALQRSGVGLATYIIAHLEDIRAAE